MKRSLSPKMLLQAAVFLMAGMALGLLLAGNGVGQTLASGDQQVAAPAAQPAEVLAVDPASPNAVWIVCTPIEVAVFSNRAHVRCSTSFSGITYFAVSTANPAHVARIISVLSTAEVAGRTLSILYEPSDTSGTSIGCLAADCRLIQAVGF